MQRIRLIHFDESEAARRAQQLTTLGYHVDCERVEGPADGQRIRADPPDIFLIDLTRNPSLGLALAVAFRRSKSTRHVPLLFMGGAPEKIEKAKQLLPDATYTVWPRAQSAIKSALRATAVNPVVPAQMAVYAGTPLSKKLGIKPGISVCLLGAPEEFEETLGDVPEGVEFSRQLRSGCGLCIWFVRSLLDLQRNVDLIPARLGNAPLWIAWPKKGSGVTTDVTQNEVREMALAAGLVDYKICSIDSTWSGLLFSTKNAGKAKRAGR